MQARQITDAGMFRWSTPPPSDDESGNDDREMMLLFPESSMGRSARRDDLSSERTENGALIHAEGAIAAAREDHASDPEAQAASSSVERGGEALSHIDSRRVNGGGNVPELEKEEEEEKLRRNYSYIVRSLDRMHELANSETTAKVTKSLDDAEVLVAKLASTLNDHLDPMLIEHTSSSPRNKSV